jgi:hypothetical protein
VVSGLLFTFVAGVGLVGLWYGLALGVASGSLLLLRLVYTLDWEREALAARSAAVSQGGGGDDDDQEISLVDVCVSSPEEEEGRVEAGEGRGKIGKAPVEADLHGAKRVPVAMEPF